VKVIIGSDFFRDTELLESKLVESLLQDNQELKRILAAILKTSKESEEKGIKN
jgi:hypothetical protein